MKKYLSIILFFSILSYANAQIQDKYLVQFSDKNNSPFSFANPQNYLSQKSILRRTKQSILIDSTDIPVNPSYLLAIKNAGGIIINKSKWFNSAIISISDPSNITAIENLSFVSAVTKVIGQNLRTQKLSNKFPKENNRPNENKSASLNYGGAFDQINQINGIPLHDLGFTGKGIIIAVLDAGFTGWSTLPVFDSLRLTNRILGTYDFVNNEINVEDDDNHGTNVLSTMGGNVAGTIIGTAPQASYYLLRTEDAPSEYLVEEYNWAAGAEFADSVGADIINSSLGYTEFDATSQNHVRADLNGNTTPVTRAANIAASKGILVCNSAGNSGNDPWFYIGAPADGDKVFSIGANDITGAVSNFSSRGPTSIGGLKPNVSALGVNTFVAYSSGGYGGSNGTSFSSPVIAGMSACLLQSSPNSSNFQLMDAIQKSSSIYSAPNFELGYGIPNFNLAMTTLGVKTISENEKQKIKIYPNPLTENNRIEFFSTKAENYSLSIIDLLGKTIQKKEMKSSQPGIQTIENFIPTKLMVNGLYFLQLKSDQEVRSTKFLIRN